MADEATGYDYSQYQTWQVVKTPGGGTYYRVPNTPFVYDPFLSQTKGRPVLWQNPQPGLDSEAEAKAEKERQIKLQEQQLSPMSQVLPMATTAAGAVAAPWLLNQLGVTSTGASLPATVGTGAAQTAAPGILETVGGSLSNAGAFTNAALGGSFGPVASGAEYAASLSGAGTGATTAGGGFLSNALPIAGGLYGAYTLGQNLMDNKKDPLGGAASGAALGASVGSVLPGVGTLIGGGIGAVVGGLAGLFGTDKSTKERQAERWGNLEKQGIANVGAAYQANHPQDDSGTWKDGKYAGQKWTFEKAQDLAKEDPTHFLHVYGNYKTFGNDWNSYGVDKQKQIVGGLVNAGLYKSEKGDIQIKDEAKAREIKDQILAGTYAPTAAAPEVNASPAPSAPSQARSSTKSPGIGLDGKRIGIDLAKRINARG
jgi:gas vesicle protein